MVLETILICPACELALFGNEARTASACPRCNTPFEEIHPRTNCMVMPDMYAIRRRRITSDEEERMRKGSNITQHYERGENTEERVILLDNDSISLKITYDHDAKIILINSGTRSSEEGYILCKACNRWLFGEKGIENHIDPEHINYCRKHATTDDIARGVYLYTRRRHDVVVLETDIGQSMDSDDNVRFMHTLKETVIKALQVSLNLSVNELDAFLAPHPTIENANVIVLYETAEGGVGILKSLLNITYLRDMARVALELLHDEEPEKACQVACYDCLLSYGNQRIHHLLDRNLVLPLLRMLTGITVEEPKKQPKDDRFDYLLGKCDSELERNVLNEIRYLGLKLPDEAQETIFSGDRPVAKTDFFYKPDILLFVDGPVHEKDYVVADDKQKRRELRGMGYRVFSIKELSDLITLKPVLK